MIEYIGEYGTEVNTFLPYIYYLKTTNRLKDKVLLYNGMRPYYYFLEDHEIVYKNTQRFWIPHTARSFLPENLIDDVVFYNKFNPKVQPKHFVPPPFKEHYSRYKIESAKPILILQNKYNMEWGQPPKNFIDVSTLRDILHILSPKYDIVYFRSNNLFLPGYSRDANENESLPMDDKEMIKNEFASSVTIFEDVLKNVNTDFNTFKCILHANASAFVSVIGGHIDFSNYFPGTHVIYKNWLPDCFHKDFYQKQHRALCPNHHHDSKMYITTNYDELKMTCKRIAN